MNIKNVMLETKHRSQTHRSAGSRFLVLLIKFYRVFISPWIPATCRYVPTCSQYGVDAIQGHGAVYGGWLAAKRILRCHPFGGEGYDPAPAKDDVEKARTDRTLTGMVSAGRGTERCCQTPVPETNVRGAHNG